MRGDRTSPGGRQLEVLARVRQLGDVVLWEVSAAVGREHVAGVRANIQALEATLLDFRSAFGFGRAIAAPQVGIMKRIIAFHLAGRPFVMIDPVLTLVDDDRFALWDDCMSFPDLLVRVERYRSVSVDFFDRDGAPQKWETLPPSLSELVQHEVDHLDGILALDRRVGADSVITREAYTADPGRFDAMVGSAADRAEADRYVAACFGSTTEV